MIQHIKMPKINSKYNHDVRVDARPAFLSILRFFENKPVNEVVGRKMESV